MRTQWVYLLQSIYNLMQHALLPVYGIPLEAAQFRVGK